MGRDTRQAGGENGGENGGKPFSPLRVGGMALENGVLFQTDRLWAMGIRGEDGEIQVVSGRKIGLDRSSRLKRIPLLRGLVTMAETLLLLPRVKADGGRLPLPVRSPEVLASTLVSVAGSIALRNPKRRLSPLAEELLASALALVPSLLALRKSSATQYHAAEHKSINAYERNGRLTREEARTSRAQHPRCGSNVVGPALALMAAGNLLSRRVLGRRNQAARVGVSFLSLSGAIELTQWASRHRESPWARAFTCPGGNLQQAVTTAEPSDAQLEVGLAALRELLRLEGACSDGVDPAQGQG
jgi:uncharacterized protein YqhQ